MKRRPAEYRAAGTGVEDDSQPATRRRAIAPRNGVGGCHLENTPGPRNVKPALVFH
jgi:hypothetical protein